MRNSLMLERRDSAVHWVPMRQLFCEGTGSNNVEDRSDPFQGAPHLLWGLLNFATSYPREGLSATTGEWVVITRNQIDRHEVLGQMVPHIDIASSPIVLSPASILDGVRTVFGLNISETAEVFCITRQTAYQWMKLADMEQVRAHENRDRLKELYGAAQFWKSFPPLKGRWLHALLPSGNTMLDLLKAIRIDLEALRAAHHALATSTATRQHEEGERVTQAVSELVDAFAGLGAGRKARKG